MPHGKHGLIILGFVCCIGLSACNSGQQVSYNSGGMTHTWEDSKDAAKDFPLPIYPNSKPSSAIKASGDGDNSEFMILISPDPVKTVVQYYSDELPKKGWKVSSLESPNSVNMTAVKEGQQAGIMVSLDDKNQTSITLAMSDEPEGVPKVTDPNYVPDTLNPPTD